MKVKNYLGCCILFLNTMYILGELQQTVCEDSQKSGVFIVAGGGDPHRLLFKSPFVNLFAFSLVAVVLRSMLERSSILLRYCGLISREKAPSVIGYPLCCLCDWVGSAIDLLVGNIRTQLEEHSEQLQRHEGCIYDHRRSIDDHTRDSRDLRQAINFLQELLTALQNEQISDKKQIKGIDDNIVVLLQKESEVANSIKTMNSFVRLLEKKSEENKGAIQSLETVSNIVSSQVRLIEKRLTEIKHTNQTITEHICNAVEQQKIDHEVILLQLQGLEDKYAVILDIPNNTVSKVEEILGGFFQEWSYSDVKRVTYAAKDRNNPGFLNSNISLLANFSNKY